MEKAARLRSFLLYHAGRIMTYGIFGLFFGMAGRRIYMAGWQQGFSIFAGMLILFFLGHQHFSRRPLLPSFLASTIQSVQRLILFLWKTEGRFKFLLMGMANGLLPCGMVYLALAVALGTSHPGLSILFMVMFGLGTFPALLGLRFAGNRLDPALRLNLRRSMPYLTAALALLLILRGLNLGIPMLSPFLARLPADVLHCH
jgi:sulfite exporter TauE/SafE